MSVTCVIGTQWGDEGKGKIVDFLAKECQMVVRFQGSDNAGHTVVNEHGQFGLHLIPSGIFNRKTRNLLGPGTGINPISFLSEIDGLAKKLPQLDIPGRMFIAERAHVIMPYHVTIDSVQESARGDLVQGTTGRGNGPLYADKYARAGILVADLFESAYLERWLEHIVSEKNRILAPNGNQPLSVAAAFDLCQRWADALRPYVVDSFPFIQQALSAGENILLEGQLGIMRDVDWGHYPYVTSSSPTAGGAAIGSGIAPRRIDRVIGVAKAFTSSVGEGPFPTELGGVEGEKLRTAGGEYGVSTGRPRRVGWMDAVAVRYAIALNGIDALALTKIDLLDDLDEIPICRAYRVDGETLDWVPNTHRLTRAEPIYDYLPGWRSPTNGIDQWSKLPANAQAYVRRVEEITGAPVKFVGTGQERSALICR